MTIYLRICFSSQPVVLYRRAVRRGANAGPICDGVIHALAGWPGCPSPSNAQPFVFAKWIKRDGSRGVDGAGTKWSLAQYGRTAGCRVTVASRAPAPRASARAVE
jgi:hypothetical protein